MTPRNAPRPTARARPTGAAHGRLSIGALSRATGVPVETLRTWETRYGFPQPERSPSGHRRYGAALVPRLRRITEALARGHRASETVPATDDELALLLEATPITPDHHGDVAPAIEEIAAAAGAVSALDADALTRHLLADYARLGLLGFLDRRVAPLVRHVGDRWADGRLQIRHEHFASERIADILRTLRLPFEEQADGPLIVCATLPGEQHGVGLQMAALVAASAGCRVLYLGTEVPVDQMAAVTADAGARALAISVSLATGGRSTRALLVRLRRLLPRRVHVLIGGDGASPTPGAEVVTSFRALQQWCARLAG